MAERVTQQPSPKLVEVPGRFGKHWGSEDALKEPLPSPTPDTGKEDSEDIAAAQDAMDDFNKNGGITLDELKRELTDDALVVELIAGALWPNETRQEMAEDIKRQLGEAGFQIRREATTPPNETCGEDVEGLIERLTHPKYISTIGPKLINAVATLDPDEAAAMREAATALSKISGERDRWKGEHSYLHDEIIPLLRKEADKAQAEVSRLKEDNEILRRAIKGILIYRLSSSAVINARAALQPDGEGKAQEKP